MVMQEIIYCPKKFATTVTHGNIEQIKFQRKKQEEKQKEEIKKLQELANEISNLSCTITVKTNKEGKLFGSVTASHIADTLSKKGYQIDGNMIILETPIKKCDLYNITIMLHPEVKAQCRVWIVSESEKPANPQKEPSVPSSKSNSEEKKN
ncbi:MAG: 50S ribosomal protein L9 [Candidatus Scalindua rubra]|uniref:50S ribosomal protein L9 n=1 Tax=Candidatus Scalindua rubra TaxID=1872076 RepID=A0A1E3X5K7_9BACT|nr:MAG: 50S ribosomal protein L9 [Candidatus Scalindua rubra]